MPDNAFRRFVILQRVALQRVYLYLRRKKEWSSYFFISIGPCCAIWKGDGQTAPSCIREEESAVSDAEKEPSFCEPWRYHPIRQVMFGILRVGSR